MQQLEVFPEDIRIERVDPEANMYRFYRLRLMGSVRWGVAVARVGPDWHPGAASDRAVRRCGPRGRRYGRGLSG